jgi:hypothetical protein
MMLSYWVKITEVVQLSMNGRLGQSIQWAIIGWLLLTSHLKYACFLSSLKDHQLISGKTFLWCNILVKSKINRTTKIIA